MEDIMAKEAVSNDSDEDIDFTARKKHGKQALRIDETDSEPENGSPSQEDPAETNEIVGGSNSEQDSNESKESSDDGEKVSAQRKKKRTKKKSDEQQVNDEHKSKMNALCDEESSSSSDESDRQVETSKPTKIQRAPQRMSAKQAEEQMKVIQSESQRLARECHLSVPYHKPKQYSLKDFLNRRTINRPVPMTLTKKAAATIKMSKEELEQYAKSLEDRNKESQEFYRSDSDNSNNDDKETDSKCDDEQQTVQPEQTNAIVDMNDAVNITEEPTESTSNVAESTHSTAEKSNEATVADVEVAKRINITEDVVESTSNVPDVRNEEPDIVTENVSSGDHNDNVPMERVPRESIEIDYSFGENERNEVKTLKDLLPLHSTVKPCLKGPINGVINLDVDDSKPTKSGGDELLERFIKHVALKPNRSAKGVSILSTDNGVIELSNIKIESDDQNCIHSKPRKDVFKLKEELSLRIAAKRKEELMKKQMSTIQIPMEDSCDSEEDIQTTVNDGNKKENYESDIENNENGDIDNEKSSDEGSQNGETIDGNDEVDAEEDKEEEEDDEANEEDEIDSEPDGCELVQKSKQRKRIILMDNSDEDEDKLSEDGLNTTSISLDDSHLEPEDPIDKTMSQICANQSRADQMIDSCSRIVPEKCEADKNMSTLFTQTADDISVSELLDLCSGSFATQATNAHFVAPEIEPSFQTQVNNFSENEFSDDEVGLPKKSKQRKVVNISDDEDQDDESNTFKKEDRNESDAEDDNLSEEDEDEEEAAVERIVEYDSEENEIEVPVQVQKKKIADFFENEAELSESEWGSADEDERHLDKFEMELGDEDEFDQNQLVSELDRIHRRRMLDQDAREVKIIKDTHFEDEEESGLGRQRQYKWKHMENSLNMDENNRTVDPDANENAKSDEENEETWRRMRYERNNILQETKNQNDVTNESKLIVAVKTKKRISIVKTGANLNTSTTKDLSFLINRTKEEQMHRSSLLIRDEKTLANLAKMTTDDGIPSVNTNSKNFLFNVISSEEAKPPPGKRKLDDDGTEGMERKSRKVAATKKVKKSTLSVLDKLL